MGWLGVENLGETRNYPKRKALASPTGTLSPKGTRTRVRERVSTSSKINDTNQSVVCFINFDGKYNYLIRHRLHRVRDGRDLIPN